MCFSSVSDDSLTYHNDETRVVLNLWHVQDGLIREKEI